MGQGSHCNWLDPIEICLPLQVVAVSRLSGALADIALSGLPGWVSVLSPGVKGEIHMRVWAPVGVEVFVRPPIPVPGQQAVIKDEPFW